LPSALTIKQNGKQRPAQTLHDFARVVIERLSTVVEGSRQIWRKPARDAESTC
jgi:hypothetical protein